ncbi:MAG: 30S ribosomal protein S14 [Flavobacteriales bacterium]
MAKESMKAKDKRRKELSKKYAEKREQLKKEGRWEELQKLPRNSSKVRNKNRCNMTGRPRGYMRDFGLSRIAFRNMALEGKIPGIKKSSW